MKQGCSAEKCGAERVPLDPNRVIPAWEVFETQPVPTGFALREHLLFPLFAGGFHEQARDVF